MSYWIFKNGIDHLFSKKKEAVSEPEAASYII